MSLGVRARSLHSGPPQRLPSRRLWSQPALRQANVSFLNSQKNQHRLKLCEPNNSPLRQPTAKGSSPH